MRDDPAEPRGQEEEHEYRRVSTISDLAIGQEVALPLRENDFSEFGARGKVMEFQAWSPEEKWVLVEFVRGAETALRSVSLRDLAVRQGGSYQELVPRSP